MFNVDDVVLRYRIVDFIQRGGTALVYKARNLDTDATVALKVLDWDADADPAALVRLRKEAAAVTALQNEYICPVFAIEPADGHLVIEMEFIEGRSLDYAIAGTPLPIERILTCGVQLAAAFRAAHARGVLHLDFKPSKVVLSPSGVKVIDFGLGWILERSHEFQPSTGVAMLGAVLSYASPEHLTGGPRDTRSDLFSLGSVLYEMATGVAPFAAPQLPALMSQILHDSPPPVTTRNPAVPESLARIISRLLQKDPSERYQTAADLLKDLELVAVQPTPVAVQPAPPAAAQPAPALRLERLGRYEIVRHIATTAMADVYLAHDTAIGREVIVKALGGERDALGRKLFLNEARAAGRLHHPNIVTIFDVAETDGQPWLAMEYVRGSTLLDLIRVRRPIGLSTRLDYMQQVCAGLAYAHRAGIVHRDIKPANIMVSDDGVVKILDFGIAQWSANAEALAGSIAGTLGYMAPETLRGDPVDARADIFAVGAVLYELLSYRKAFPQGSLGELSHHVLNVGAPYIEYVLPDIDPELAAVVDRCLAIDPDQRFPDMDAARQALATAARSATNEALSSTIVVEASAPASTTAFSTAVVRPATAVSSRDALADTVRPAPPISDGAPSTNVVREATAFGWRSGLRREPKRPAASASPTSDVQFCDRTLDLAIAPTVPVLTPIELIAFLRRPEAASLASLLELEGEDTSQRITRTRKFAMEFPVIGGEMRPAVVTMRVTAPDFTPSHAERVVRVRPDADAAQQSFLLTPNVQGKLRIQFDVIAEDNVSLASRAIETDAGPSDRPVVPPRVIASVPLEVTVVRRRFAAMRRMAAAVAVGVAALAVIAFVGSLGRTSRGTGAPASVPQPAAPRSAQIATSPPAAAPAAHGESYGLIIGIDEYTSLQPLQTAVNDARTVGDVLREQYGFQTELLLNASRFEIISALNRYRTRLNADTNLLIYYAGHGYYDKDADKAYWLPADAQQDVSANWIIADEITSAIKVIPSRHVLIVSDSCYSGGLSRDAAPAFTPAERSRFLQKMEAGTSRTLLASGGNEPVADSGGADNHSVFASALLNALHAPDITTFTGHEMFAASVGVAVAGRSQQTPQYSVIRNSGHDSGDFVFVRRSRDPVR